MRSGNGASSCNPTTGACVHAHPAHNVTVIIWFVCFPRNNAVTGIGPFAGSADWDLFEPFADPIVELHTAELTQMLLTPFNGKVPASLRDGGAWPDLLVGTPDPVSNVVSNAIVAALKKQLLDGTSSEIQWSGFWDAFVTDICRAAGTARGLSVVVRRDVADVTVTVTNKRRDYYLYLSGRSVVIGEDKPSGQLAIAVDALQAKHERSSPFIFGRLKICIGFATSMCQRG